MPWLQQARTKKWLQQPRTSVMSATAEHEFGMKVICLGGAKLLRKTLPAKGRAATHSVHSIERVSEGAARVC